MLKTFRKLDGVIQAVRYAEDGNLESVRLFLRKGAIWTDRLIYDRSSLIKLLQSGKKIYVGRRKKNKGGEFQTEHPVRLHNSKDRENIILAGVRLANHDQIKDAPVF